MTWKAALATTALASTLALGTPGAARAEPVTGLYVGGGAGYNYSADRDIAGRSGLAPYFRSRGFGDSGKLRTDDGYLGVLSLGWGFGNGFRAEIEGNYRENDVRGIGGFSGSGGFGGAHGTQRQYGAMANVFFDFDMSAFGLTLQPYIGGGIGYLRTDFDNVRATRAGTNGGSVLLDDSDGSFAYQGIAGVAFPIAEVPGLSVTAEYRYLGSLRPVVDGTVVSAGGATVASGHFRVDGAENHSGLIGLRYAFNQPAPPPPPAPAPVAQTPAPARTFLVFFDWDRADLTARARDIIAEAARNSRSEQVTRLEVNGHTDRSGAPQYNQALSLRRANVVAAELVRDGVPRAAITIHAYGESKPLVPTADGVREPQNRRVEIILN